MKRLPPAVAFEELSCGNDMRWEWVHPAILLKRSPREAAPASGGI
ncbi:hypothetical protein [Pseudoalteromonas sp. A757]|nr:hypothetical protein [Pseudoalteromonas sp. A757]